MADSCTDGRIATFVCRMSHAALAMSQHQHARTDTLNRPLQPEHATDAKLGTCIFSHRFTKRKTCRPVTTVSAITLGRTLDRRLLPCRASLPDDVELQRRLQFVADCYPVCFGTSLKHVTTCAPFGAANLRSR